MEIEGKHSISIECAKTAPETQTNLVEPMSATSRFNLKMIYSSNTQASFTLLKSFIGTGVLALPYAFKTAGVGLSILMTILIGTMLCYCFLLLLETATETVGKKKVSFPKLAAKILGAKGKYLVQTLVIIEQLGCCIGIIIFTKDFLNHILCAFEIDSLCGNTAFNIIFSLGLVVPLSMINNMHYFYIPSLAANVFIMIGLLSQMFFNIETAADNPEVKANFGSTLFSSHVTKLPLFFGVALFSFEGVGLTFSIRDSMEKPEDLPKILKSQMMVITTIYIIFSTVSCIALGDKLEDIVFFSLPTNQPFYLLIQILYAISALFTYPIQLFPALRIMEHSEFLRDKLFTEKGKCKNIHLRYSLRLAVIGLVFLVAYISNSFHLFLDLLGSCVFTSLGFGLPILLYMVKFKGKMSLKTKVINYGIAGFIGFFGILGFIFALIGLISGA